jgi:hypothetical protein
VKNAHRVHIGALSTGRRHLEKQPGVAPARRTGMRTHWPPLAAILLLTAPASARTVVRPQVPEPIVPARVAVIEVHSGATIASTELALHRVGTTSVATLTLTLTARQLMAASTTLALPPDARVVGMVLAHGTERFVARPLELREAELRFAATVDPPPEIVVPRAPTKRDPAILQIERESVVRLTVFPIAPDAPATVTVQLALPRTDRMQLLVGDHLEREQNADESATADELALASQPAILAPDRALYAAPLAPVPTVSELANTLAGVMPTLQRCAAVDEPGVAHHVSLEVHVDALGHAWLDRAEGANGTLIDCLRQVVAHMQLGDDAPTALAYQLEVAAPRRPVAASRR